MQTATPPRSVYERALGERFSELHPGLRAYFAAPPAGCRGVGRGVFATAGLRARWLRPLFAVLAWRRLAFPESGRDVPFTVENVPTEDGELRGIRSFEFPSRTRVAVDRMRLENGHLVDRLGRRGGLEATFAIAVDDGALRLSSRRLGLRVGGCRIPLPRFATVTVDERIADDRQHVDVRLRLALVGEVFGYRGSFTYRYEPSGERVTSS